MAAAQALRRIILTVGPAAGGLLTTAFVSAAVAAADQQDFTPDPTTFSPSQALGFPPVENELFGTEQWNLFDLTTGNVVATDLLTGTDTQTTLGSFTNDDFLLTAAVGGLTAGTQIDLANFGFGFENEWVDIPSGAGAEISDLLITPFGDFPILGTLF